MFVSGEITLVERKMIVDNMNMRPGLDK